jgi:phosphatidylinositol alpha-1,6-mannosyltransferase
MGMTAAAATVRVITTIPQAPGQGVDREAREQLNVSYARPQLNKKFLKLLPLFLETLQHYIRDRPDALVAMSWTHDGIVALLLKKLLNAPYTVVVHGTELIQHSNLALARVLMKSVLGNAQWIVANSQFTSNQLTTIGISPSKIRIVNPPVAILTENSGDPTAIDRKFGLTGKRVLLTAARLFKRKGHAQVIQVLHQLNRKYPDLAYVITGEGKYQAHLESLARQLQVHDKVRFVGFVSEAELNQLYRRCAIYISPSMMEEGDVEGFGIALVEAGAHGRPVIAGRTGGVEDAVVDGETGILVDPSKIDEIETALVRLLDDDDLRQRLGSQAKRRAELRFGIQRQGELLLNILRSQPESQSLSQLSLRRPEVDSKECGS